MQETSEIAYQATKEKRVTQENRLATIMFNNPGLCDDAYRIKYNNEFDDNLTNALVSARRNGLIKRGYFITGYKKFYQPTQKTVLHWYISQ